MPGNLNDTSIIYGPKPMEMYTLPPDPRKFRTKKGYESALDIWRKQGFYKYYGNVQRQFKLYKNEYPNALERDYFSYEDIIAKNSNEEMNYTKYYILATVVGILGIKYYMKK